MTSSTTALTRRAHPGTSSTSALSRIQAATAMEQRRNHPASAAMVIDFSARPSSDAKPWRRWEEAEAAGPLKLTVKRSEKAAVVARPRRVNMIEDDILRELLKTNPEYVLAILIIILSPVIFFLIALVRSISTPATDWQRRHLVKDLLNNPAIQERIKDPTLNLPEFIEQLLKGETAGPRKLGLI
jgi:hypothetical protein